jgi:hypothetical protein
VSFDPTSLQNLLPLTKTITPTESYGIATVAANTEVTLLTVTGKGFLIHMGIDALPCPGTVYITVDGQKQAINASDNATYPSCLVGTSTCMYPLLGLRFVAGFSVSVFVPAGQGTYSWASGIVWGAL